MPTIHIFLFCWAGACFFTALIYILAANGQLYCTAVYIGHCWSILKEEVMRPVRVIRKALNRKRNIELDEYERHLS